MVAGSLVWIRACSLLLFLLCNCLRPAETASMAVKVDSNITYGSESKSKASPALVSEQPQFLDELVDVPLIMGDNDSASVQLLLARPIRSAIGTTGTKIAQKVGKLVFWTTAGVAVEKTLKWLGDKIRGTTKAAALPATKTPLSGPTVNAISSTATSEISQQDRWNSNVRPTRQESFTTAEQKMAVSPEITSQVQPYQSAEVTTSAHLNRTALNNSDGDRIVTISYDIMDGSDDKERSLNASVVLSTIAEPETNSSGNSPKLGWISTSTLSTAGSIFITLLLFFLVRAILKRRRLRLGVDKAGSAVKKGVIYVPHTGKNAGNGPGTAMIASVWMQSYWSLLDRFYCSSVFFCHYVLFAPSCQLYYQAK